MLKFEKKVRLQKVNVVTSDRLTLITFGALLVGHPSYILNFTQKIKAIIFAHSFRRDAVRGGVKQKYVLAACGLKEFRALNIAAKMRAGARLWTGGNIPRERTKKSKK